MVLLHDLPNYQNAIIEPLDMAGYKGYKINFPPPLPRFHFLFDNVPRDKMKGVFV